MLCTRHSRSVSGRFAMAMEPRRASPAANARRTLSAPSMPRPAEVGTATAARDAPDRLQVHGRPARAPSMSTRWMSVGPGRRTRSGIRSGLPLGVPAPVAARPIDDEGAAFSMSMDGTTARALYRAAAPRAPPWPRRPAAGDGS